MRASYRPVCSRISCSLIGILSMDRVSSRTSQGNGFRSLMPPSLPIRVNMNPRGRSLVRTSVRSSGDVSVINTTSRSASSSSRATRSSIWRLNAGSAGVSAKTITGRANHLKSFRSIWAASKMVVLSASQRETASAVVSAPNAAEFTVIADKKINVLSTFGSHTSPVSQLNIWRFQKNRRGQADMLAIMPGAECRKRG